MEKENKDIKDKRITFKIGTLLVVIIFLASFFIATFSYKSEIETKIKLIEVDILSIKTSVSLAETNQKELDVKQDEQMEKLQQSSIKREVEYAKISTQLANIETVLLELKDKIR